MVLGKARLWMTVIMKNRCVWGISVVMAMAITACGVTSRNDMVKEDTTDVTNEAVSGTSGSESTASFDDEETEENLVADADNLPDSLEDGETAMLSYNMTDEEIEDSIPDVKVDFEVLREKNSDICAYIVIPGTSIDNPVLKKDDSNEYYLEHGEDNESDSAGCIFIDMGNETDFTDPVTCLYANAGEGEPFYELINYLDKSFMEKNEFIYVYSDDYVTQYRVFAAYSTDETERPLVKYNFYDYAEYTKYLDDIFETRDMSAAINNDLHDEALSSWNIITLMGINEDGSRQVLQAVFNGRTSIY